MVEGIEAFYEQIAEALIEAIPEEWSAASFESIFYPEGSVYEAEYTRKSDGTIKGFQPASSGSRSFRQLRNKFKEAGKPLWGKARFELWPDGTFNMRWDYDDCDRDGNALFDEDQERRRHDARRIRLTANE